MVASTASHMSRTAQGVPLQFMAEPGKVTIVEPNLANDQGEPALVSIVRQLHVALAGNIGTSPERSVSNTTVIIDSLSVGAQFHGKVLCLLCLCHNLAPPA
jgi:hypothetical protein